MTESAPLKGCIDCIYCEGSDLFLYCKHPDYSYETKDYIRGVAHKNYSLCVLVRDNDKLCGDSARGWEENPSKEPEYYPSLWGAFRGLFR